jgi:L-alanine-DL-glutamate epimerase-like enolase superfamily enzyme
MNRRQLLLGIAAGGLWANTRLALAQATAKARPLALKITGLRTIVVNVGGSNWVFCKVLTNQGLTGLGEGSTTSKEATVVSAIMDNERFLIGKDPTEIELLWQGMFRYPRWRGGPILNSAISAIEIALWDILGKALGVPIYRLLGGAARRKVRLYSDLGDAPEDWVKARQQGYTAGKGNFIAVVNNQVIPTLAVREGVRKMAAVRKAVGDDFDIAVDVHGKLTPTMAVDFCTRAEELRPLFVEEATQIEDLDELALLRSKTRVPLATGERLFNKYGFAELCHRHLVDYVQPDVCHAGGILELKKIAAIAEAHRVEMAPHNPQSEVSTLASLHVDACSPACTIQEYRARPDQWLKDLFYGGAVQIKQGYAELPDRPGLGVDLDEKVAAKHPYQPATRPNLTFPDGATADY